MEKQSLKLKDSVLAFFVSFLLSQVAVLVATCIVASVFNSSDKVDYQIFLQSCIGYAILSFVMYSTILGVFLVLNRKKENEIFKKPKLKYSAIYISIAILSFFILYPIVNCFDSLLVKCGIELGTLSYPLTTKNYFFSLFSIVLLPAVIEELLFRGLIFKGLKRYGKTFSIVTTALLFAIYHMSISQTIYPILFGALLTFVMYRENNLFYCIFMHLVNNFLALTISYFNISLVFNSWIYIVLAIVLVSIFVAVLAYAIAKLPQTEKQQFEQDKFTWFAVLVIMLILWITVQFIR